MNQPDQQGEKKKQYLFYRILGYINNFIAIFFLFVTLMSFAVTGFNPSLLLYLFIFLSILIYTNLTAVFARHVMVKGHNLRSRLKDWIKVNAIVALLFGVFTLVAIVYMLVDQTFIQQITDMYSGIEGVTDEMIRQQLPFFKGVLIFFLICTLILVLHVIFTFRYLKRFEKYFRNEIEQP